MKILSTKSINSQYLCGDHLARKIWQEFFNYYRDFGGRLDRMDDLLIDYDHCKEFIAQDETNFKWAFSSMSSLTAIYRLSTVELRFVLLEHDHCIEVNIGGEEVEFIHHIQES